jgi:hypothetical protein
MKKLKRFPRRRSVPILIGILLLIGVVAVTKQHLEAESRFAAAPAALEAPPEKQTYMGSKECSACHFDQYLVWRKTKHAKSFEILPSKYQKDASCLECHTTGHGHPTGFKSVAASSGLVGTSCEACHGPGSEHGEIAKSFGKKKLSEDEEAYVRSTIWLRLPDNACVACHQSKAHKEHPPYDK